MKPGERLSLITQLADTLSDREWDDIDLHLRTFDIPWSETWPNADKRAYLLHMLQQAEDSALLALHEHLFGFSGDPTADFWSPGRFRLFISHISAEKEFAQELKEAFASYGIDAFVAHADIRPTREWMDEIEAGLHSCDALLALLTAGFKESDWTDQEVGICHGRHTLIVSVRRGIDPYGFISRYQAVPGIGRTAADIAKAVVDVLKSHAKTEARMAEALVGELESARSYARAKEVVAHLADVRNWTPDLLRRLEEVPGANDQVRNAWGVPDQITRILREQGYTPPSRPPTSAPFEDDDLPF